MAGRAGAEQVGPDPWPRRHDRPGFSLQEAANPGTSCKQNHHPHRPPQFPLQKVPDQGTACKQNHHRPDRADPTDRGA